MRTFSLEVLFAQFAVGSARNMVPYPYSLLFSQNRSSSVLYKENFSRGILLSAPDRQAAQYLVRQQRKIQLICKRKRCGAKPTLGRTTK